MLRADLRGSTFTAKLGVVAHYSYAALTARRIDRGTRCSGQKRDLEDPSLGLSDGYNGLRTLSLKPASNRVNRHTLKAALSAAILVSEFGATGETKKAAQRFSAIGR